MKFQPIEQNLKFSINPGDYAQAYLADKTEFAALCFKAGAEWQTEQLSHAFTGGPIEEDWLACEMAVSEAARTAKVKDAEAIREHGKDCFRQGRLCVIDALNDIRLHADYSLTADLRADLRKERAS